MDELAGHFSPLGWEHINLTGDYVWDLRQTTTLQRVTSTPSLTTGVAFDQVE